MEYSASSVTSSQGSQAPTVQSPPGPNEYGIKWQSYQKKINGQGEEISLEVNKRTGKERGEETFARVRRNTVDPPLKEGDDEAKTIKQVKFDMSKPTKSDLKDHHAQVGEVYSELFKHDKLTDVTIETVDTTFNAHKAILIAHSQFLKKRFKNTDPLKSTTIELKGMPSRAFKVVLEFMYTAEAFLNMENIADVHTAAHQLIVEDLLQKCENYVKELIPHDALIILNTASDKTCDLFRRAFLLVLRLFSETVEDPLLLALDIETLMMILVSDDLVIDTEINVFHVSMAWIQNEYRERAKYACQIMNAIRFCYMKPREILGCTKPMKDIQPIMRNAMWYSVAKEHDRVSTMPIDLPPKRLYQKPSGNESTENFRKLSQYDGPWPVNPEEEPIIPKPKIHGGSCCNIDGQLIDVDGNPLENTGKTLENTASEITIDNVSESDGGNEQDWEEFESNGNQLVSFESSEHLLESSENLLENMLENDENESRGGQLEKSKNMLGNSEQPLGNTSRQLENIGKPIENSRQLENIGKPIENSRQLENIGKPIENSEQPLDNTSRQLKNTGKKFDNNDEKTENSQKPSEKSVKTKEKKSKKQKDKSKKAKTTQIQEEQVKTILVIGGWTSDTKQNPQEVGKSIYAYTPRNDTWKLVAQLPDASQLHDVAFLNNCLYVLGGARPVDPFERYPIPMSSVFKWNLEKNTWSDCRSMNYRRIHHRVTTLKNRIYAIGGQDEFNSVLDSVEKYNPVRDKWEKMASMKVARIGMGVTSFKGKIMVAGGYEDLCTSLSGNPVSDVVESFDPSSNRWTVLSQLSSPRFHCALLEVESDIYIIGGATSVDRGKEEPGVTSVDSVMKYDQTNDEWKHFATLKHKRHGILAAVVGNKIIIMGGVSSTERGVVNNVECLDTTSGESTTFNLKCKAQFGMGVAVCDAKLMEQDYFTLEKRATTQF